MDVEPSLATPSMLKIRVIVIAGVVVEIGRIRGVIRVKPTRLVVKGRVQLQNMLGNWAWNAGRRHAVAAPFEAVAIAGRQRDRGSAADCIRLITIVPRPRILNRAGFRRIDHIPTVVAIPPSAAPVKEVARVAGLIGMTAEAIGALPVSVGR